MPCRGTFDTLNVFPSYSGSRGDMTTESVKMVPLAALAAPLIRCLRLAPPQTLQGCAGLGQLAFVCLGN